MSAPPVGTVTARTFEALPEVYRAADEASPQAWPLLRWLDLLLGQLEPVVDLIARLDYRPADDPDPGGSRTAGDLVNPARADAAWLPWLAQLLGVDVAGLVPGEQRTALSSPATSWARGTVGATAAAAARGLSGDKVVVVTPGYGGDPWTIGIGTRDAETTMLSSWAALEAAAPTWGEEETLLPTWASEDAPLVLGAVEPQRPAGFRFVRYSLDA